jgi:hypothetical protein
MKNHCIALKQIIKDFIAKTGCIQYYFHIDEIEIEAGSEGRIIFNYAAGGEIIENWTVKELINFQSAFYDAISSYLRKNRIECIRIKTKYIRAKRFR